MIIFDGWLSCGYPNPQYDNHRGAGVNAFQLDGSGDWIPADRYKGCNGYDYSVFDKM